MSYAYASPNNNAEYLDDPQQSSETSIHKNDLSRPRQYPSPSPSMSSSGNAPSPSAFMFSETPIVSSIGPSVPNRIMTRRQRKAATAMNVGGTPINRSQTPHPSLVYPLTPDSQISSSVPHTPTAPRQLSTSPALSSISSHSHRSQRSVRQQQDQMSMSPTPLAISPTARGFHLPGPQPNSLLPSANINPPLPSGSTLPRAYSKPKARKQRLFNVDRKAICEFHLAHPGEKQEVIARQYGVERSTISKILKHKERWLSIEVGDGPVGGINGPIRLAKHRPSKFPPVESEMLVWIREVSEKWYGCLPEPSSNSYDPQNPSPVHGPLSDASLREKARAIARSHGITPEQFKASSGWVENFKHRHGIRNGFWGGYLGNVQGRNVLVARSMGLTFSASVPPPISSSLTGKVSPALHRHSTPMAEPESEEEETDLEDGDDEDVGMGVPDYQPSSALSHVRNEGLSRPPWSTDSSSTSTSRDSPSSPHPDQRHHVYNTHQRWSSESSASHPSSPAEQLSHRYSPSGGHYRSVSGPSLSAMNIPAHGSPYSPSPLENVPRPRMHSQSAPESHVSHVQGVQNVIESDVQHSHSQQQNEVLLAGDPHRARYTFVTSQNSDVGMHLTVDGGASSVSTVHPYSSEYPFSDVREHRQPLELQSDSYTHQPDGFGKMESSSQLHAPLSSTGYEQVHLQSDARLQNVLPPPPPISDTSMPTLAECEDYLTKISFFVDMGSGQGILTARRREWLRKLKVAFFEAGSGIPITPDSDEEG
ncbi:hypothetical protein GYMLUDRAFT_66925 [Collybiopsis luxurians FD-317 M1]|nr:hypothetical protein GYMLUDRAFT_66925 [Collybiopsis luxurians FD-317 M1]